MIKKLLIPSIACMFFIAGLKSQNIANYAFSTSATAVPEDMSSNTTQLIGPSSHDVSSAFTGIGFTFYFMSEAYTTFSVNANGQLSLGDSLVTSSPVNNALYNIPLMVPISGGNSILSTGKVHYMVKGTAPDRILIVEWKDLNVPFPIVDNNPPVLEYNPSLVQVFLHESTGSIEFKYGTLNNNSTPDIMRSTFISSGNTPATVKYIGPDMISAYNAFPVGTYLLNQTNTGLFTSRLYSFTPPAVPTAPTWKTEPVTSIEDTGFTLNWNDLSTNETGFLIYCSTDGGITFSYVSTAPANTTSYDITGSLANINNYWRIAAVNEGAVSTFAEMGPKTLTLSSVLLQGLYDGSGTMRQAYNATGPNFDAGIADNITVELHDAVNYSRIIYSIDEVPLSTTGTATVTIPAQSGSYYITVKHRNSLETTTAIPVSFAAAIINQSFATPSDVYGHNLALSTDNYYLIYAGDVNQDGKIDTKDFTGIDNDVFNFVKGYLSTDIDGNGKIDSRDFTLIDNNNFKFIRSMHP